VINAKNQDKAIYVKPAECTQAIIENVIVHMRRGLSLKHRGLYLKIDVMIRLTVLNNTLMKIVVYGDVINAKNQDKAIYVTSAE